MCKFCDLTPNLPHFARCLLLAGLILLVLALILHVRDCVREHFTIGETRPVRSQVDGMSYMVHTKHANSQGAADLLATLSQRMTDLMRWLRRRYIGSPGSPPTSPVTTPARVSVVHNLQRRFNPDNFAENSPLDTSGDSSYCLDKGAMIAVCLRARPGGETPAGELHNIGILTFVTIHEIAHSAIEEVDHPPHFWSTFKFLLEEARLSGVYKSPNFANAPLNYCGVRVNYNPLFDVGLPSI